MRSSRNEKKKRKKRPAALIVLPVVLLIAIFAAVFIVTYIKNYDEALDESPGISKTVTIPRGAGTKKIGEILQDAKIIKSGAVFRLKSKFLGFDGAYQAGDFRLSSSMGMEEIMDSLKHAKGEVVRFTVPEGLSIRQVAEKLTKDGLIESPEKFYEALEEDYDFEFLKGIEPMEEDPLGVVSAKANRLEGFLFPDTYEVYKNSPAKDIVNIMLSGFEKAWEDSLSKSAEKLGKTSLELATIASLIERETKKEEERPLVSAVIYNRLEKGMKLGFCSSVQYILGENKERLLYKDLETESPYNTYKNFGLPVGPIASAGLSSLKAAAAPKEGCDYLFFVLKGDGSGFHNFTESESEFLKFKKEYQNSLK